MKVKKSSKDEANNDKNIICETGPGGVYTLRRSTRRRMKPIKFVSDGKLFNFNTTMAGFRLRCFCLRSFPANLNEGKGIYLARFIQHTESHVSHKKWRDHKNMLYKPLMWKGENTFLNCYLCSHTEIAKCDKKKFIDVSPFMNHLLSHQLDETTTKLANATNATKLDKPTTKLANATKLVNATPNIFKPVTKHTAQCTHASKVHLSKNAPPNISKPKQAQCMHANKVHSSKNAPPRVLKPNAKLAQHVHANNVHSPKNAPQDFSKTMRKHAAKCMQVNNVHLPKTKNYKHAHSSKQIHKNNRVKHACKPQAKHAHVSVPIDRHASNKYLKLYLYPNFFRELLKFLLIYFLLSKVSASNIVTEDCPIKLNYQNLLFAKQNYSMAFHHIQFLQTTTEDTQMPILDERVLKIWGPERLRDGGWNEDRLKSASISRLVYLLCYREGNTLFEGARHEFTQLHDILLQGSYSMSVLVAAQYGNNKLTFWGSGKQATIPTYGRGLRNQYTDLDHYEKQRIRDGGVIFVCIFFDAQGIYGIEMLDNNKHGSTCQIICQSHDNDRFTANFFLADEIKKFQMDLNIKNEFHKNIEKFDSLLKQTNAQTDGPCKDMEIKPFFNYENLGIRFDNETLATVDANLEITEKEKMDWDKLRHELLLTKTFLRNAELLSSLAKKAYSQPVEFWDRFGSGYDAEIMALVFLLTWALFFIASLYCWYRLSCQTCLMNLMRTACPHFHGNCCVPNPHETADETADVNGSIENQAPVVNHNYIINRSQPHRLHEILNQPSQPSLEMQRVPMLDYDDRL